MSVHQQIENSSDSFGASIHGGRPTFAIERRETGNEPTVTLYELLPTDQADARQRRLERSRQQMSKTTPIEQMIGEKTDGYKDWTWDNWIGVKISRLSGARLRSILKLIDKSLREAKIKPGQVTSTGSATILVPEEVGVRLSLGFIGIKPLRRVDRMRDIARGVAKMSLEECYYWNAKCRSPRSSGGAKALRTLLTE
jgi:hypothetical protein